MTIDQSTDIVRQTLVVALIISSPILLIGLGVGLVISLVQAVTQIQEQTLSFVPKIVAMVAVMIFLMPWISQRMIAFASQLFAMGVHP
jgi:flagellar biosynthetic protein FliQ